MSTFQNLEEAKKYIQSKSKIRPQLGFVLGSGLSAFAGQVKAEATLNFSEIPHFSPSTIEGHPGKLILGTLDSVPVAVLQGRLHAYEGLSFEQVIHPIRTLKMLGVQDVVVTNASGGLKKTMRPGDFMVIADHINLTGSNPLRGENIHQLGPRFVDMTEPYDKKLSQLLTASLKAKKVRHSKGIYCGVLGPTYETAAEIRFFGKIGGSAVGMSTVAEVIAARHAGLRVVGLSCITNLGTGLSKSKLDHDDVKNVAARSEKNFISALLEFVKRYKKL